MRLFAASLTDRGLQRRRNEDSLLVDRDLGLFAVGDGLGGHPGGEIASQLALDTLRHTLETVGCGPGSLERAFEQAEAEVRRVGFERFPDQGMGTTLTALLIVGHQAYWGHAGDSALFRLRAGELEPISTEHTLARLYANADDPSEDLRLPASFAHTLTLCVGLSEKFDPDFGKLTVLPGDRFILCSDGVTKVLTLAQIARHLGADLPLDTITQRLRAEVFAENAPDNLSIVLVRVED